MDDKSVPDPKDNQLFKGVPGDWYNVCLDPFGDNWWPYILGYKEAADIIIIHYGKSRKAGDNFSAPGYLIYPVLFLYRHFIELLLKLLIREWNKISNSNYKFDNCHYIDQLWIECRKIIEHRWPSAGSDELDETEQIINKLSLIDKKSLNFRYPFLRDGSQSIPEDLMCISLRILYEDIEKIDNFLRPICDVISIELCELSGHS